MTRKRHPPLNYLRYGWLFCKSRCAFWRAARGLSVEAKTLNRFGVRLGVQLMAWDRSTALSFLLAPLASTRYFELPFVLENRLAAGGQYLDLSSPRLVSLYVAKRYPTCSITVLNPDPKDLAVTEQIKDRLNLSAIETHLGGGSRVPELGQTFDCIWSVSVLEHIAGDYDDRQTVRLLFHALRPGGRLILTVPVDRTAWIEYRSEDYYGQQEAGGDGRFFFQRFYDMSAIRQRIIQPTGVSPVCVKWFGEVEPGRFHAHTKRIMSEGIMAQVMDPLEMTQNYCEFASWEQMPGVGVCCLVLRRPIADRC